MPKIVPHDLWESPGLPGMWVVTTNSYIKHNGALVMGRGAARQAMDKLPNIEYLSGAAVERISGRDFAKAYGFLVVVPPTDTAVGFGVFQVKWHWKDPANLGLIQMSVSALAEYADINPDVSIRMNYPGIGNGRLKRSEVGPLLTPLPENVTICWR
ncbi:MAG: hypothetical protein GY832_20170 [Chloroflexi bacterium]|nr:hypothetical protein [Chloroflexota bacterium]